MTSTFDVLNRKLVHWIFLHGEHENTFWFFYAVLVRRRAGRTGRRATRLMRPIVRMKLMQAEDRRTQHFSIFCLIVQCYFMLWAVVSAVAAFLTLGTHVIYCSYCFSVFSDCLVLCFQNKLMMMMMMMMKRAYFVWPCRAFQRDPLV